MLTTIKGNKEENDQQFRDFFLQLSSASDEQLKLLIQDKGRAFAIVGSDLKNGIEFKTPESALHCLRNLQAEIWSIQGKLLGDDE